MTKIELTEAVAILNRTPNRVRELTSDLGRQSQIWKPPHEMFSILENVCHLRDIEAEGYAIRIRKILTEEFPALPDLDGARLAVERRYNSDNLESALAEFQRARANSLSMLDGIDEEALTRRGNLENVGPITLAELLKKMIEHDTGHIEELEQLRKTAPK